MHSEASILKCLDCEKEEILKIETNPEKEESIIRFCSTRSCDKALHFSKKPDGGFAFTLSYLPFSDKEKRLRTTIVQLLECEPSCMTKVVGKTSAFYNSVPSKIVGTQENVHEVVGGGNEHTGNIKSQERQDTPSTRHKRNNKYNNKPQNVRGVAPLDRAGSHKKPSSDLALGISKIENGLDPRTSIMIRNIPNKYTQQMMLAEINVSFQGTYDFFYLPIDFTNQCNLGYAFINFVDSRFIVQFQNVFNGRRWDNFNSNKTCAISYARIQGRKDLVNRFKGSSVMDMDPECQPVVFYEHNNTLQNSYSAASQSTNPHTIQSSYPQQQQQQAYAYNQMYPYPTPYY
uniref:Mei2-like C-terminal RNA recognition motif domain-containing protein n=1 Tax=Mucochytrium quahogii TaxID=96639 RepID=A0A7S2S762_9STRA|mmetsp:Transcript_4557/g.6786  ORF Transcript_4557/g.6786 Transcript_4557/m.6786 type:complete len:345 (+) Transcript_4557:944-1978(+)